jgi:ribosomal protein S18 acetylase RimI-like enzyme
MGSIDVVTATKADLHEVAYTLGRAFFDDPVMTWLLPEAGRRAKGSPIMFATMGRHHYLPAGGIEYATDGTNTAAAAMWAPPGKWETSRWTDLRMLPGYFRAGGTRMKHGLAVDELMKQNHPEEPHWYLAFIGSDPTYRGGGYGHALMSAGLARADAEHAPAYLESSNPDNLGYYERFGFEVTGELVVPDGPTLWPMWRQPR